MGNRFTKKGKDANIISRSQWNKQKAKLEKQSNERKILHEKEQQRIQQEQKEIIDRLSKPIFQGAIRCDKSCCHYCLFATAAYNSDFAEVLVPLKAVKVSVVLDSGISSLDLQLTYTNLDATSPIETTFEFPLDSTTVLS